MDLSRLARTATPAAGRAAGKQPDARAGRRRVPLPRAWNVRLRDVVALLAGNALLIVGMWVRHGGLQQLGTPGGLLTAAGQLSGLLGAYLILVQVLLMSRIPWLEQLLGMDRLTGAHRWVGFGAVSLLLAHGTLVIVGYALGDGSTILGEAVTILTTYQYVLLATIGNAAEHSTALILAHHDDMDTALTITLQSSLQIALFAVPVLVLLSAAASGLGFGGGQRMDLIFTPMEVVAVLLSVGIVVVLGLNGQTNWFEGVLLLAVYAILALAFFYIPASPGDREYHDVRGVQSPPRHTGGVSQPATHAAHRRRPAATTDGRD
jgi:predicted ferric reductase